MAVRTLALLALALALTGCTARAGGTPLLPTVATATASPAPPDTPTVAASVPPVTRSAARAVTVGPTPPAWPAATPGGTATDRATSPIALASGAPCPVTRPNGSTPPGEAPSPRHHGNGEIWVGIDIEANGVVQFRPDDIEADGSFGRKVFWWRGIRGYLTIEGHRIDAPAPPLRARIPEGYGPIGFQSSAVYFPTDGCWEVTGRVTGGDSKGSLTFVVLTIRPTP